ncbi:MAG: DUF2357 domain-containing protein, partial [Bacteroidetes bacterium]|nr:DUF2357 domain-containing protein [Bacteroidota bacterium]
AYLPADQHRYTLDTPEHRWLAGGLARLHLRLAEILDDEQQRRPGVRRRQVLREMDALQHRLADLRHLPVLTAAEGEPPLQPTQRLRTAPGYREAYQACLRLQRGLVLDGAPLRLALKDLHRLYEYWCTLTLVRLLAALTGDATPLRDLVAVEQRGLTLRLRRGRRQRIRFTTGEQRITVTYNPRFGGRDVLVPQQPDLLLSVQSAEGDVTHYILDAKYRLDASPRYRRRYGLPGPPPDALNTLHRYRDAIRIRGQQAAQAVVLYPWRDADDQYPQSRHRRTLDRRGIGAIPLLPGATGYLRDWLERIVRGTAGG